MSIKLLHHSSSFTCQACLDVFHHNIDIACNLCETSGPFLYWSPETTMRLANIYVVLLHLKNVKDLDSQHGNLMLG